MIKKLIVNTKHNLKELDYYAKVMLQVTFMLDT